GVPGPAEAGNTQRGIRVLAEGEQRRAAAGESSRRDRRLGSGRGGGLRDLGRRLSSSRGCQREQAAQPDTRRPPPAVMQAMILQAVILQDASSSSKSVDLDGGR